MCGIGAITLQFDEAIPVEEPVHEESEPNTTETITYTRNKKGTGRKTSPTSLPYIEQIHDLSDAEKQCACGCALTHIRNEVTDQLDVVPQITFRVVHIRKQYSGKGCEETM